MAWRAICDRCGFKRWNSELRKEWTGLMVCRDTCWEARNAQDFVKGVPDKQNPPWVRPEPADDFLPFSLILLEDGGLLLQEGADLPEEDDGLGTEQDFL